jgi:pyruvate/2-oxoglutarate dehydrogenase complex dihydrolipoamide acyltransferase (E2) component
MSDNVFCFSEAIVDKVLLHTGDLVAKGQDAIVLKFDGQDDKVKVTLHSPFGGMILEVNVKVGDKLTTGAPIAKFHDTYQMRFPPEQGDAVCTETMVKVGDSIQHGYPVIGWTTTSGFGANEPRGVAAPFSGKIIELDVKVGDKLTGNMVVAVIQAE